ncbi:hypothetical protein OPV22_004340 [Ensete ventricosum]|uniref:40S ribosomal protein S12 n=1 Tax=Ensete ventricosum TaxID=4639 RepID=A0AAV8S3J5_ENSVE|nr:hypothetical protein OPV22_004340 [Ensete ventricosum]
MRSAGKCEAERGGEGKAEREREKTKLRERRRRSITSKIFEGLRKHGGYDLPARADINDVLRALAREAGWVVEPDGTTYRSGQRVSPVWTTINARGRSIGCKGGGGVESSVATSSRPPPAPAGPRAMSLSPLGPYVAFGGARLPGLCVGAAGGVAAASAAADAWPPEGWAWGQASQLGAPQQNSSWAVSRFLWPKTLIIELHWSIASLSLLFDPSKSNGRGSHCCRIICSSAKAIEKHAAQLCVLAEDCNQADYVKLVKALCADHNVHLVTVPSAKTLGEWAGLCKIDSEGKARKVVGCSCVVVKDYGEESEGLHIVQEYVKSH